jgi:hypothetical protein
MDAPVGERPRQQVDHGPGVFGLGRAVLGDVQPKQHRQEHGASHERHGDDQPDHHKAVAPADAVTAFGRSVVLPGRAVDQLAVPMEQGVINGDRDRRPGRDER